VTAGGSSCGICVAMNPVNLSKPGLGMQAPKLACKECALVDGTSVAGREEKKWTLASLLARP